MAKKIIKTTIWILCLIAIFGLVINFTTGLLYLDDDAMFITSLVLDVIVNTGLCITFISYGIASIWEQKKKKTTKKSVEENNGKEKRDN